jgi:predicted nucleotidyltransferase
MAQVERISIALSSDLLQRVRGAVETGDYTSTSEVIREALREWKLRRPVLAVRSEDPPEYRVRPVERAVYPLTAERTRELEVLCERFQVKHLGLFGSVLRADFADRSDVDVVVEFVPSADGARLYFDFKAALEVFFGRSVDLVELNAMPESRLKRIIERTQVLVYAEPEAA